MKQCILAVTLVGMLLTSPVFGQDACAAAAPPFERTLGLDLEYGCRVFAVLPGSLAAQKGIEPGDVILALNDKKFREHKSTLEFTLRIKGEAAENGAVLRVLKYAKGAYNQRTETGRFVINAADLNKQKAIGFNCQNEAVVVSVDKKPLSGGDILPGDFVLTVNGQNVIDLDNAIKIDQAFQDAVHSGRVSLEFGRWAPPTFSEGKKEMELRLVVIDPSVNP